MTMATKIETLEQLKGACTGQCVDFFIQLNFGMRSSKCISYDPTHDLFWVLNEIDGSEQSLTSEQIMDEDCTNIGKAIKYGSFFKYD